MSKETLTVEWLPRFKKWRVWNSWIEGWYKNFDEFVKAVNDNALTVHYNFYSYTESTRKRLVKYKLLKEENK